MSTPISANHIIGDLIAREKYKFVDGRLIASIVDDAIDMVRDAGDTTKEEIGRAHV